MPPMCSAHSLPRPRAHGNGLHLAWGRTRNSTIRSDLLYTGHVADIADPVLVTPLRPPPRGRGASWSRQQKRGSFPLDVGRLNARPPHKTRHGLRPRRAAEPAFDYSINSSARSRKDSETIRPIALAVLTLITS